MTARYCFFSYTHLEAVSTDLLDVIRATDGPFVASEGRVRIEQVGGDEQLVALWLHGRTPHTQRAYTADAGDFLAFVSKPLRTVTFPMVGKARNFSRHWRILSM